MADPTRPTPPGVEDPDTMRAAVKAAALKALTELGGIGREVAEEVADGIAQEVRVQLPLAVVARLGG